MSLTWPKHRRLTRRPQYTACYEQGERHYTRYFVVFVRANAGALPHGRLGLAVTRKCGNAVERNRIKRVLREFFRLRQQEMPVMDIVVTPKRHLRADMVRLAFVERDLAPLLDVLSRSHPGTAGAERQTAALAATPCGGKA